MVHPRLENEPRGARQDRHVARAIPAAARRLSQSDRRDNWRCRDSDRPPFIRRQMASFLQHAEPDELATEWERLQKLPAKQLFEELADAQTQRVL